MLAKDRKFIEKQKIFQCFRQSMLHCFQTAKDIQYHLRKKVAELLISHLLEYVFLLLERVLEHCLEPIVAYPVESLVIETLFKVHTRRLVTVLN